MGLFSAIGSLFGGGGSSTSVSQQAANNTQIDVGVDIQNVLDMTPIAAVLEWLGFKQVEVQEAQLAAAKQGSMNAQELLDYMKQAQTQQLEQNKRVIDGVLPWMQGVAAAATLALGMYAYRKWKGRR